MERVTDFLVTAVGNPDALNNTLRMMPGTAELLSDRDGYFMAEGCYIMRVYAGEDGSITRQMCEHQGYCRVVRRIDWGPLNESSKRQG